MYTYLLRKMRKGQSRDVKRLLAMLRDNHGIVFHFPDKIRVERTRAGHHQRSQGAWSWMLWSDADRNTQEGSSDCTVATNTGSQYPLSVIVKKGFVVTRNYAGWEIDPIEPNKT